MDPIDVADDAVRTATNNCPYRVQITGNQDYHCSHPMARSEEINSVKAQYGGIMFGGGVDDYATFCTPVDMHLTSLGEPSRLVDSGGPIIETTYRVVEKNDSSSLLPPPSE